METQLSWNLWSGFTSILKVHAHQHQQYTHKWETKVCWLENELWTYSTPYLFSYLFSGEKKLQPCLDHMYSTMAFSHRLNFRKRSTEIWIDIFTLEDLANQENFPEKNLFPRNSHSSSGVGLSKISPGYTFFPARSKTQTKADLTQPGGWTTDLET